MNGKQVALYARVSSSQQADAGTIASQLAVLRARVAADGETSTQRIATGVCLLLYHRQVSL